MTYVIFFQKNNGFVKTPDFSPCLSELRLFSMLLPSLQSHHISCHIKVGVRVGVKLGLIHIWPGGDMIPRVFYDDVIFLTIQNPRSVYTESYSVCNSYSQASKSEKINKKTPCFEVSK